jgi:hypothetical protein
MKKFFIFILILNYFFKKIVFFKKLILYKILIYYKINIFKNINQLQFNFNFFSPLFFFKLYNLKKKKIKYYSFYKYELFFRFPKNSIAISAKFLKYFNLKLTKKYSIFKKKTVSLNHIFFRLPTIGGIGNYFKNIFKRVSHLIIGSFKYLPLNYTNAGYFIPYIIRKRNNKFIENIAKFIFIKRYHFLNNKINSSLKKYNLYSVFFNQKPNINLSILFFFTKKKRFNFFEYSSYLKQYKVFLKKYKNYDFFKFNWILLKKKSFIKSKKIFNINIQSKHKHVLKYHRLSFNTLFNFRFKSHTLSHIFKGLSNYKKSMFIFFKDFELMLCHVLIRTKFVFNLDDSYFLIENGFVFINGIVCLNKNFIIKKGDRIQLINFSYEYIYQRFVISNNITRYCRM